MDTNTKYRRWGWGAVIGLIAIILIAGLVIALTMNKKPSNTEAELANDGANGEIVAVDGDENTNNSSANSDSSKSEEKSEEKSEDKSSSEKKDGSSSSSSDEKNSHSGSSANGGATSGGNSNGGSNGSSAANGSSSADASQMPKTGPVDATIAILGMAATAYLLSLNAAWAKEKVRK
jgi:cytoskeletal protein RodZ